MRDLPFGALPGLAEVPKNATLEEVTMSSFGLDVLESADVEPEQAETMKTSHSAPHDELWPELGGRLDDEGLQ